MDLLAGYGSSSDEDNVDDDNNKVDRATDYNDTSKARDDYQTGEDGDDGSNIMTNVGYGADANGEIRDNRNTLCPNIDPQVPFDGVGRGRSHGRDAVVCKRLAVWQSRLNEKQ